LDFHDPTHNSCNQTVSQIRSGQHEINCIEYPLSEEEALQFIVSHHRPQRGWNAFMRICLALSLKSDFQQRAFNNMSTGGKYKGSINLPKAGPMGFSRAGEQPT
jgi:hypothetical protein